MQDVNAPEKLRDFQIRYGKYLRDPQSMKRPEGVPQRRSEIYEGLLFNNISGFVNNCFPVAKSIYGDEEWTALVRSFFKDWRCMTPIFSQIPFEFVRYCSETLITDNLPAWLPELLHYEWVELEVDTKIGDQDIESNRKELRLSESASLLSYNWPVHTISKGAIPEEPQQTFLVVYRNSDCKVRFLELNATTFMLLQYIQSAPDMCDLVIRSFVSQIEHPNPETLSGFALQIVKDLKEQEILVGEIA